MIFRQVKESDCSALLNIYRQYIDTAVTFEYLLPSENEFSQRMKTIGADYPYLVCEQAGEIVGYAYAHRHMERAAYQWNAELSVYLDEKKTSRGIGKQLYQLLFDILRLQNVKMVYACVALPNPRSEALHESLGFSRVGTYRQAGYKNGMWHDICWFEKQIASHSEEPLPWKSVRDIKQEIIDKILKNRSFSANETPCPKQ